MEKFLSVVTQLAPIIFLVVAGLVARATDYLPAKAMPGLAGFVSRVAIPISLFLMIAGQDLAAILDLSLLLPYFLATAASAGLGFAMAVGLLGQDRVRGMAVAFGASCSNAVMIGFPIIPVMFPETGAIGLTILFLVQSCILIPLMLTLWGGFYTGGDLRLANAGQAFAKAIYNPLILCILGGMFVAFLRLVVPTGVQGVVANAAALPGLSVLWFGVSEAARLLALTAGGAALFYIGCTLHGARVWPLEPAVSITAGLKLVAHPALMAFFMFVASLLVPEFNWPVALACIALAAIPVISAYPGIASQYGEEGFASRATTLSFIASALTLTVVLMLTVS